MAERCPTCGHVVIPAAPTASPVPPPMRIKVLRSVYETRDLPAHERIAQVMDFYDGRELAKAKRMIVGLDPDEARRVLDQAICDEKL